MLERRDEIHKRGGRNARPEEGRRGAAGGGWQAGRAGTLLHLCCLAAGMVTVRLTAGDRGGRGVLEECVV